MGNIGKFNTTVIISCRKYLFISYYDIKDILKTTKLDSINRNIL